MAPKFHKFWGGWLVCSLLVSCASLSKPSKREVAHQWVELGASAVEEGDPTGALQYLARAEETLPQDASLHHVRALAYSMRKDLAPALASAQRAHELAPKDSAIATTYGKLLMESGRDREAEKVLLPAANDPLYRDAYRARTNLSIIYTRRGERVQAMHQLDRAISEEPKNACHAYYFRSEMRMKDGKIREALKDLEAATQKNCSSFAPAHLATGIALTQDRQYAKARKKFLEVTQRFPGTEFAEQAMENLRYLP
jgi:Tfp pilus assembly protein PilF